MSQKNPLKTSFSFRQAQPYSVISHTMKSRLKMQVWCYKCEIFTINFKPQKNRHAAPQHRNKSYSLVMSSARFPCSITEQFTASWDRQLFLSKPRAAPEGVFCEHLLQSAVKHKYYITPKPHSIPSKDWATTTVLSLPVVKEHCRLFTLFSEALT